MKSPRISSKRTLTNDDIPIEVRQRALRLDGLHEAACKLARISGLSYRILDFSATRLALELNFRKIEYFDSIDAAEDRVFALIEQWERIKAALPADQIVQLAWPNYIVSPRGDWRTQIAVYPSFEALYAATACKA